MPTTRARTRHLASTSAIAVVALLTVMLTACASKEGADPEPTAAPESQSSSTDSKAGWHSANEDGGRFLVPPEWAVEDSPTGINLQAPRAREGGSRVGGGSLGSGPTIESATAIDDAGDTALAFHLKGLDKAERLPDVTLGGVEFYHVRGEDSAQWVDDYGTVKDGKLITVLWTFHKGMVDRKQTDELIAPVMETFEPTS